VTPTDFNNNSHNGIVTSSNTPVIFFEMNLGLVRRESELGLRVTDGT
jgi:hypothetical protein